MARGEPLTDADRWDWLILLRDEAIKTLLSSQQQQPGSSTPNSQSTYRQRAHSSPDRAHNRSSNNVVSPRTNGSYRVGAKGQSPTQHSNVSSQD